MTVLMEDFIKAAMPKIPTLAGLKFTSIDLFDLGRCLVLAEEKIQILFGGDEVGRDGLLLNIGTWNNSDNEYAMSGAQSRVLLPFLAKTVLKLLW